MAGDVGGQAARAPRVPVRDGPDDRAPDSGLFLQDALHGAQGNLEAAELDDVAGTSQHFDAAVGQEAGPVAGAVEDRVGEGGVGEGVRAGDEALRRGVGIGQVAGGDSGAGEVQLAHAPPGDGVALLVEEGGGAAVQDAADGGGGALGGGACCAREQVRVGDVEAFPGAVGVDEARAGWEERGGLVHDAGGHHLAHQEDGLHVPEAGGEIGPGGGVVEDAFQEGGRDDDAGDAGLFEGPQQADGIQDRVVRDDGRRSASQEGSEALPGEEHVEAVAGVACVGVALVARVEAVEAALMGVEYGLGGAGGPARHRDHRDVGRVDVREVRRLRVGVAGGRRSVRVEQQGPAGSSEIVGEARGELRGGDHGPHPGAVQEPAQQRGRPGALQQAGGSAEGEAAQQGGAVLGGARQQDAHGVALGGAPGGQVAGQHDRAFRQLPVGPSARVIDHGEGIGAGVGAGGEPSPQAALRCGGARSGDGDRRAAGPEAVEVPGDAGEQGLARVDGVEVPAGQDLQVEGGVVGKLRAPGAQVVRTGRAVLRTAVDDAGDGEPVAGGLLGAAGPLPVQGEVGPERWQDERAQFVVGQEFAGHQAPLADLVEQAVVGRVQAAPGRGQSRSAAGRQHEQVRQAPAVLGQPAAHFERRQRTEAVAEEGEGRAVVVPPDQLGEGVDHGGTVREGRPVPQPPASGKGVGDEFDVAGKASGPVPESGVVSPGVGEGEQAQRGALRSGEHRGLDRFRRTGGIQQAPAPFLEPFEFSESGGTEFKSRARTTGDYRGR
ncbi:hypothetical protein NORO109296_22775 [Nocardiopsis rhodophaea]